MNLTQITPPTEQPISLDQLKTHSRIDINDHDTLLDALIGAATEHVEAHTRRALCTQTWRLTLDEWPAGDTIVLPLPPLQSVTAVRYIDEDGATTTWAASNYVVDTDSEPGRVVRKRGVSWPSVALREASGVQIEFVCGYGGMGEQPLAIKQALLLLCGNWYENTEAVLIERGLSTHVLPFGVDALLWPLRVMGWP